MLNFEKSNFHSNEVYKWWFIVELHLKSDNSKYSAKQALFFIDFELLESKIKKGP